MLGRTKTHFRMPSPQTKLSPVAWSAYRHRARHNPTRAVWLSFPALSHTVMVAVPGGVETFFLSTLSSDGVPWAPFLDEMNRVGWAFHQQNYQ